VEKAITWHTFKTSQNDDIQWIRSDGWEWWAVSGIIGRQNMSTFEYSLQRRLTRHWGAGVIHAGSRRGYLKKKSRIELCMVDKGFGGRQHQKTTLATNPKRDYRKVWSFLLYHFGSTWLIQIESYSFSIKGIWSLCNWSINTKNVTPKKGALFHKCLVFYFYYEWTEKKYDFLI
jgi:hypothetical protein